MIETSTFYKNDLATRNYKVIKQMLCVVRVQPSADASVVAVVIGQRRCRVAGARSGTAAARAPLCVAPLAPANQHAAHQHAAGNYTINLLHFVP
jgi:hypothetical protein